MTSAYRVPLLADPIHGDVPLVVVERGAFPASVHRGSVVVADGDARPLFTLGNSDQRAFLRSAAKPFQVMPAILTGGIDKFGIDDRELAVLCASHNAEQRHVDAVLSVLDRIGAPEDMLACGPHAPLHVPTAEAMWREGRQPTRVYNNCSGAHAGMLVACAAAGWPMDGYGRPDHPLQVMIRSVLAAFAALPPDSVETATDNCSVPTFRLPLRHTARAFAVLAGAPGVDPRLAEAAGHVRRAMTSYPEMVAGENRFDTALMQQGRGSIVAKGGADGFQGVGLVGRNLGVALKITDGASRAVAPAIVPVLRYVEALTSEDVMQLRDFAEPDEMDRNGEVVGRVRPTFAAGDGE